MEQFTVEEYQKNPNRKVITRDGRSVRIVCTDVMGATYPVLAVYKKDPTHENWNSYTTDGKLYIEVDSDSDLFFAPEKKEGWINLAIDSSGEIFVATNHPHKDEKTAKLAVSNKSNVVATCKITWEEEYENLRTTIR